MSGLDCGVGCALASLDVGEDWSGDSTTQMPKGATMREKALRELFKKNLQHVPVSGSRDMEPRCSQSRRLLEKLGVQRLDQRK